jgi:hypothetical protein
MVGIYSQYVQATFRDLRTYVLHKEILHLPFSVTFEPNSTLLWTCQCLATALALVNRSWKYLCIPQYDKQIRQ